MNKPEIHIYGSDTCGRCQAAKQKMDKMNYTYTIHDLVYHGKLHDNWRETDAIGLMAENIWQEGHIPIIRINGKYYTYAAGMKELKRIKKEQTD